MGKGRFVNQKLGKRTNRRLGLLKAGLTPQTGRAPQSTEGRFPKKGPSRDGGAAKT
ncbi:MAG TPA: hypothetical protein VG860_22695 [Terriglobia bacterium]|jgi:hypothetical protein|nr:hypothetical protein [Terriglobia bacterium]